MKQDLWQKFITHIILFYSPWPGYINGTVKPKIYYEYENITFICIQPYL